VHGAYYDSVGAPSVILDGTTYKMWYTRIKTTFNSTSLTQHSDKGPGGHGLYVRLDRYS